MDKKKKDKLLKIVMFKIIMSAALILFLAFLLTATFHQEVVQDSDFILKSHKRYSYHGNIHISITEFSGCDQQGVALFRGLVMIVNNPQAIKVMIAEGGPGNLEKTSSMAQRAGAVAAVNGGGFFNRPVLGWPLNHPIYYTVHKGKVVSQLKAYNDELLIGLTDKGELKGLTVADKSSLEEARIMEGVSFQPRLIKRGNRMHKPGGFAHPRTAMGIKKDGSVLFVVIDGRRTGWSTGVTLYQLQEVLLEFGAYNAFNLDGGGSSTMVFDNNVINKPSDFTGERKVATCWIIIDKLDSQNK